MKWKKEEEKIIERFIPCEIVKLRLPPASNNCVIHL